MVKPLKKDDIIIGARIYDIVENATMNEPYEKEYVEVSRIKEAVEGLYFDKQFPTHFNLEQRTLIKNLIRYWFGVLFENHYGNEGEAGSESSDEEIREEQPDSEQKGIKTSSGIDNLAGSQPAVSTQNRRSNAECSCGFTCGGYREQVDYVIKNHKCRPMRLLSDEEINSLRNSIFTDEERDNFRKSQSPNQCKPSREAVKDKPSQVIKKLNPFPVGVSYSTPKNKCVDVCHVLLNGWWCDKCNFYWIEKQDVFCGGCGRKIKWCEE